MTETDVYVRISLLEMINWMSKFPNQEGELIIVANYRMQKLRFTPVGFNGF